MVYERIANCSNRIREALSIRGMKQADLCRITKIPRSAMSQYLRGTFEPKQDRIYKMAQALNVSEAWLMGLDVPMKRQHTSAPPGKTELSEEEKLWLEVYHKISPEMRELLIAITKTLPELPEGEQSVALRLLRAAVEENK